MKKIYKKWISVLETLIAVSVMSIIISALAFIWGEKNVKFFLDNLWTKITVTLELNSVITDFNIAKIWWAELRYKIWDDFFNKRLRITTLWAYEDNLIEIDWVIARYVVTFQKENWSREIETIEYKWVWDELIITVDEVDWVVKTINWREFLWAKVFLQNWDWVITFSL